MKVKACIFCGLFNILAALFFTISAPGHTQAQELFSLDRRIVKIEDRAKVAGDAIRALFEDSRGYIWLGTWQGLIRYDSHTFKAYQNETGNKNSLSNNVVSVIREDKNGILWLGTIGGGLNKFNPETGVFNAFQHDANDINSISNDIVVSIEIDAEGIMWVGTWGGGLNRFDPETNKFTRYPSNKGSADKLDDDFVIGIHQDSLGNYWTLNRYQGLKQFFPETGTFKTILKVKPDEQIHWTDRPFVEDAQGIIWFVNGSGIGRLDPKTKQVRIVNNADNDPANYKGIIIDSTGIIWAYSVGGNGKLFRLDPATEQFKKINFSDSIFSALIGSDNQIWIGSRNAGLFVFNQLPTFVSFLSDTDHKSEFADLGAQVTFGRAQTKKDAVWMLYRDNAILKSSDHSMRYEVVGNIDLGSRQRIPVTEHSVWFSSGFDYKTSFGVVHWNSQTGEHTVFAHDPNDPNSLSNNWVLSILRTRDGRIWLGTDKGINLYQPETGNFKRLLPDPKNPLSADNNIRTMVEGPDGNIWTGGWYSGLTRLDPQTGKFTRYRHSSSNTESLDSDTIYSLIFDSDDNLWIGSLKGIEMKPAGSDRFETPPLLAKAALGRINCILQDMNGYIWMATNKGISRYDYKKDALINLDSSFGLSNSAYKENGCLSGPDGLLFFSSADSVDIIDPTKISSQGHDSKSILTEIRQNNIPVPIGPEGVLQKAIWATEEIRLPSSESEFALEFVALNYRNPQKVRYRYKLEPLQQDWIETDSQHRIASYTNLPWGEYRFTFNSTDSYGAWSEKTNGITITIVTPLWASYWAIASYFMVSLILFTSFAVFRRIKWLKKQAEQREIAQREERMRLLLNASAEGIFGLDPKGICTFANHAASRIFGFDTADDLIGKDILSLINLSQTASSSTGAFVEFLNKRQNEIQNVRDVIFLENGGSVPVEFTTNVVHGSEDTHGHIVTINNISRLLKEESRLKQTQKVELLGQLVNGITHDLNNNLNVILLNLSILNEADKYNVNFIKCIERALTGTQNASSLCERLLDVAKPNEDILLEAVDLAQYLHDTIDLIKHTITSSISVNLVIDQENLVAEVDTGMFQNALLNLAINARDAMPKGGVLDITLDSVIQHEEELELEQPPGQYCRIRFTDNGSGISEADLKKVVEPFFTTKNTTGGTGLGMAMVNNFITKAGGYLNIESVLTVGTTVTLFLPRSDSEPVNRTSEANMFKFKNIGGQKKILVIEDHPQGLSTVCSLLTGLGFNVVGAQDGYTALKAFDEHEDIHMVLSDVDLPGSLNGFDLAEQMIEKREGTQVFFVTGVEPDQSRPTINNWRDKTLIKPFKPSELMELLNV